MDEKIKDKLMVAKKDGSIEEFQPPKIARVVKAAGLSQTQADLLAKTVNDWTVNLGHNPITYREIRDKVVSELKIVNPYAANLFEWYEKTKV